MTSKIRSLFLSSTIIAVLLFSAIGPTTVYADDGTPTETPTADASGGDGSSDEGTVDVEAPAPVDEVVPVEDGTATETPADTGGEDGSSDEGTTDLGVPVTVDESAPPVDISILDEVPENTTVAVLNTDGEPQPLAARESANAISKTSDPIWCPAGQAPTPGANGCTASFTSFDALLTELSGNPAYQQAGTIFVEQNAYGGGESVIDFNSYSLTNIQNFDLTVTGGWNTTTNVVDPANSSTFSAPIIIGSNTNPWGGSLAINNISISGTNGTGLSLYSQNNITLSNVQVSNSITGAGALLSDIEREFGFVRTALERELTVCPA